MRLGLIFFTVSMLLSSCVIAWLIARLLWSIEEADLEKSKEDRRKAQQLDEIQQNLKEIERKI